MNQITVIGNISEPELKYTSGGRALLTFGLATTRIVKEEKVSTWHNVKVWGDMAELVANSVNKGSRVIVTGRIEVEKYEAKDGSSRTSVSLVADDCGVSLRFAPREFTPQAPEEEF